MNNPSLRIKSLLAVAALSAMVTDYRPLRQKSNYDYSGWDETIDTGRRKQKADDALSKAQAKRDRKAAKRAAIAARLTTPPDAVTDELTGPAGLPAGSGAVMG